MTETEREIGAAIRGGINYFDTAYIYPGSEEALGNILEKNGWRDKIYLATKLPHYMIRREEDIERYFQVQLKRLKTSYIDYYLMHMLPDAAVWNRLKGMGIENWIREKKERGQIRHIGFSYHGNAIAFMELLDSYDWDFCQIQYNYMDENTQAGRRGLKYASAKGMPVVIMEPLRGGRLAGGLPPSAEKLVREQGRLSPAGLAFAWLYQQPEVTTVLSGMNSMEMLEENIRTAGQKKKWLSEDESLLISQVRDEINANIRVGCTGCSYCMPCPQGVDIPGSFRCYNERFTEGWFVSLKEYIMCTTMRGRRSNASLCVGCGLCEKHCPQQIPIRQELKQAARVLETPVYRTAAWAIAKSRRLS